MDGFHQGSGVYVQEGLPVEDLRFGDGGGVWLVVVARFSGLRIKFVVNLGLG